MFLNNFEIYFNTMTTKTLLLEVEFFSNHILLYIQSFALLVNFLKEEYLLIKE